MIDIVWQCKSELTYRSFRERALRARATGGNAYDFQAMMALSERFEFDVDPNAVRGSSEGVIQYWRRLRSIVPRARLVVKDPQVISFSKVYSTMIQVGLVHHLNLDTSLRDARRVFFQKLLLRHLRRMSAVVTVSKFWQKQLIDLGCSNVRVIYNSFDLSEFEISESEVSEFRRKHGLTENRPLIYIGMSTAHKGTEQVYDALKGQGYDLVMTGRSNDLDVGATYLDLGRMDYLRLLSACDIVIVMSTMTEGWSRVAHEALLCKTPVIGSGSGGMGELLSMTRQNILTDFGDLAELVRTVLGERNNMVRVGHESISKFDLNYFRDAWTNLAETLLLDAK